MTGYYKDSIRSYAQVAQPLNRLIKVKEPFVWGPEQDQAFSTLKAMLMSGEVMAYPVINRPYKLYTDACDYAIGGILVQVDPDSGMEKVICYVSHQLGGAQLRWSTIEKEGYAVIYCITKLRPYLYGADFKIFTDHKPLKSLFTARMKNTKIERWAILLSEYGASIHYHQGRLNVRADMLSRIRSCDQNGQEKVDTKRGGTHDISCLQSLQPAARATPLISQQQHERRLDKIARTKWTVSKGGDPRAKMLAFTAHQAVIDSHDWVDPAEIGRAHV
jgi:hypothetical protein